MADPILKSVTIRPARLSDSTTLRQMHEQSLRVLAADCYTEAEIDAFLAHIGTMDDFLLHEGTYYVVVHGDAIVASGGWSRKMPNYAVVSGGDRPPVTLGVPKIRSMFVHPMFARRGLATLLARRAETEVVAAGYDEIELTATLSGVPFYAALGYQNVRLYAAHCPGDIVVRGQVMHKRLSVTDIGDDSLPDSASHADAL
ncbi:GNAT family N-acetyltransferase [Bauldia sp.]|uniref:GNAT family N-acetyltransferase n=1 Tax=Bauldia sp. TaxID=2575872 RepID=UPI003BABE336